MKRYKIIFILLCLAACEPAEKQESKPKPVEPSEYEQTTFQMADQDCRDAEDPCTHIRISYPVFPDSALHFVNLFVDSIKSPAFDPDKQKWPIDSFANDFIGEFEAFKTEFPESAQTWFIEYDISPSYESDSTITIKTELSEYLGGAHGNYSTFYFILDKKSGKQITLSEILNPETINILPVILSEHVDTTASLFSEVIYPNENFIVTEDSISFYYNPYEIAPFSDGVIKVTIPLAKEFPF